MSHVIGSLITVLLMVINTKDGEEFGTYSLVYQHWFFLGCFTLVCGCQITSDSLFEASIDIMVCSHLDHFIFVWLGCNHFIREWDFAVVWVERVRRGFLLFKLYLRRTDFSTDLFFVCCFRCVL